MAKQKTCSKCGGHGPFAKDRRRTDGFSSWCIGCHRAGQRAWRRTPRGYAFAAWRNMKARAGNADGRNSAYRQVKVLMTEGEFFAWAVPAFTDWMKAHPGEVPSIDRPCGKHYSLVGPGKLRVISRSENVARQSRARNPDAPPGKWWCSACKRYLAETEFYYRKTYKTFDGKARPYSLCKKHKRESDRRYRQLCKKNAK